MDLYIRNRPNKVPLKRLKFAINVYIDKLLGPRLAKNIRLTIIFRKNLWKDDGSIGNVIPEHLDDRLPRDFIMELDPAESVTKIFTVAAHECVHLKQYARGELKDYERRPNCVRWKDEIIENVTDHTADEYWFWPWEVEAYGLETGLYKLYKKKVRNDKSN